MRSHEQAEALTRNLAAQAPQPDRSGGDHPNIPATAARQHRPGRARRWVSLTTGASALAALAAALIAYGPAAVGNTALALGSALGGVLAYTIVPFLALIMTLVLVHELGHYAAARLTGLRVLDFSLGFGRVLWQGRGRHNTWTLRLLPFGGYVQVPVEGPGSLAEATTATRIVFTAAGPAVNLAFAFVFYVLAFMNGLTFTPNRVAEVIPGGPAYSAGIQAGDRIVAINGVGVRSFDDIMVGSLYGDPNHTDTVTVERGSAPATETLTMPVTKQNRLYGVRFQRETADGPIAAMRLSRDQMAAATWSMLHLPFLVSTNGGDPITLFSGPVGIAHVTGNVVRGPEPGLVGLQLVAMLNLGLALINLLPLPIFDGGRILIYAVEGLVRRRTPLRLQNFMAGASLGLILTLGMIITTKDVIELFGGTP